MGTVGSHRHCYVQCLVSRGEHAGRAGEIVEMGGCVSSRNHPRLAALHIIISALLLKPYATSHCGVLGRCPISFLPPVHRVPPCPSPAPAGFPLAPGALTRLPFPSARGGSSSEAACRPPGAAPTCRPRPVPRAKCLGCARCLWLGGLMPVDSFLFFGTSNNHHSKSNWTTRTVHAGASMHFFHSKIFLPAGG